MTLRVAVVVHDANRTGPPIFAVEVVEALAADDDLAVDVVLLDGGPLEGAFAHGARVVRADRSPEAAADLVDAADVVYLNTAITVRALPTRPRGAVLAHVHELDVGLRHYLPPDLLARLLSASDRFLVGPECARRNLVEGHGVPADRVRSVPYFAPGAPADAVDLSATLGLDPGTTVVGACGVREWRKGPDVFAQLAWELRRRRPSAPLHFVWVGGDIPTVHHWDAADLDLLGLRTHLTLLDHQPDTRRWIGAFDVFALTSREDTFPLVCLEAAAEGVPIVCFDAGGIPELLAAAGAGAVAPFLDVPAMADAVERYLDDPVARRQDGDRLRRHVEVHHRREDATARIVEEIREVAA